MRKAISGLIGLLLVLLTISSVFAHQPYFEEMDTTFERTISIADPAISTALYGTLESPQDVDFYTFQGRAGDAVLFGMSIPDIEGQENFTPSITLIGAGLDQSTIPAQLSVPAGYGTQTIDAGQEAAQVFFEPFSRTSYWRRQRQTIQLPSDGLYTVAVWSNSGQVGRYTLVVGEREVRGGDPNFSTKIRDFWTPVLYTPPTAIPPTSIPPTAVPPTVVPATAIPPTATVQTPILAPKSLPVTQPVNKFLCRHCDW